MSERMELAYDFVRDCFRGKVRDDGITPAATHAYHTAENMITLGHVKDEDLIIAGLLHDCIEDAPEWIDASVFIRKHFGQFVRNVVQEVTLPPHTDFERKTLFMVRLMEEGSPEAVLVKLCDRLDNLRSMGCWKLPRQERYIEQTQKMLLAFGGRAFRNENAKRQLRLNSAIWNVIREIRRTLGEQVEW